MERTVSPDGHNVFTLRGSTRARLVRGPESGTHLVVPDELAPLIGVSPPVTTATRNALLNLGYLLDDDQPARCVFQLDRDQAVDRTLLERLETQPLLRIARWPDGAGAALCISGDLDALSLADYARRLSFR